MLATWKRVFFFDREPGAPLPEAEAEADGGNPEPAAPGPEPPALEPGARPGATAAGAPPRLYMALRDGRAAGLGRDVGGAPAWAVFPAHAGEVRWLGAVGAHNLLLTLGGGAAAAGGGTGASGAEDVVVKSWDLARLHPRHGPAAVGAFRPQQAAGALTCASCLADPRREKHAILALGTGGGQVVVLRGDLRAKVPRPHAVVLGPLEGGGAVEACLLREDPADGRVLLVACTRTHTCCWELPESASGGAAHTKRLFVDDEGGAAGCLAPAPSRGLVVCARPAGVYFYGRDGRGTCVAMEGAKWACTFHAGFLAVAGETKVGGNTVAQLLLYDLANRLVVAAVPLVGRVKALVSVGGHLHAVMEDWGQSFSLVEKSPAAKLDLLLRKNLYVVAQALAQQADPTGALVADVKIKFGDHLYAKQDYDGAMSQYLETIGHLEPSYVIRKYLDAQQIPNLAKYLERLHVTGRAAADHTALLLICYAKMKDVGKLDEFLKRMQEEHERGERQILFDAQTAIQVCRSVLYHEHALYVAKHTGEDEWYLRILVDDFQRYDDVLKFLVEAKRDDAIRLLKKHGKKLLAHRPEETNALMLSLCNQLAQEPQAGELALWATVRDFMSAYIESPGALRKFLEDLLEDITDPVVTSKASTALLELLVRGKKGEAPPAGAAAEPAAADPALALMKKGWVNSDVPAFDANHALIQCKLNKFYPGLALMYSRLHHKVREALNTHIINGDYLGLVQAAMYDLDATTGGDISIWADVLAYLGSHGDKHTKEINQVVEHIESNNLMPPTMILKMLFKHTNLTLTVVKDFVSHILKKESAAIEEDKRVYQQCKTSAEQMRKELEEMNTQAQVFQNNSCSLCAAPLELPAVHFLCNHSFHSRCLGETPECPLCMQQNQTIMGMQTPQVAQTSEQDKFFSQLKHSSDGFSIVTQYAGRGWLSSELRPEKPGE